MMHRKPTYRVYVEEGSRGAMAHVAELPGCFAVGSNASRAAAATPKAIRDFLVWLRSHREPLVPEAHVARPNLADISVMEVRAEGAPLQAGSKAAIYAFDTQPWSDEKVERTLRWLTYSRSDLLSVVEGISDEELRARQIAPGRTLWQTLWHVANAEYGYIDSVVGPLEEREGVTDNVPSLIRERLVVIRDLFRRYALSVQPDKRGEIIYPIWNDRPGEPWTLQKALRRAIEHELEHLSEIH